MTTKLQKCLKEVNKYSGFGDALRRFHEEFQEVYGYDYSDVDDDQLIDAIDYDGDMKWKDFQKHMESLKNE